MQGGENQRRGRGHGRKGPRGDSSSPSPSPSRSVRGRSTGQYSSKNDSAPKTPNDAATTKGGGNQLHGRGHGEKGWRGDSSSSRRFSRRSVGQYSSPGRSPKSKQVSAKKNLFVLANHFQVALNFKEKPSDPSRSLYWHKVTVNPREFIHVVETLLSTHEELKDLVKFFDGHSNIYGTVLLPTGSYPLDDATVHISFHSELNFDEFGDFINGKLLPHYDSGPLIQGVSLLLKRYRETFVSRDAIYFIQSQNVLGRGIVSYNGHQQSLKNTSLGLALCVNTKVSFARQPVQAIDFLKNHIREFGGIDDLKRLRDHVNKVLVGMKVRVIHRKCSKKYTIAGLTNEDARDISFDFLDQAGNITHKTTLVDFYNAKWKKVITYPNIPCLDLGKKDKANIVPIEFCTVVEGQRYNPVDLERVLRSDGGDILKDMKRLATLSPSERFQRICEVVAEDGPLLSSDILDYGVRVHPNMTKVLAHVIDPPRLQLGNDDVVDVDKDKCSWEICGRTLVQGSSIQRWALLDFTDGEKCPLKSSFTSKLVAIGNTLGMKIKYPVYTHRIGMTHLSSVDSVRRVLDLVLDKSKEIDKQGLQLIVCVMTREVEGYAYLKWLSELQFGVVTQCFLSSNFNKGDRDFLAYICLKINMKLGGENFNLLAKLPNLHSDDRYMFIGADVCHSKDCSIAAVVGSVNWPASTRYAARIRRQERGEQIADFGAICLELVKAFTTFNGQKPKKIVVFRDGVGDSQIDTLLLEEYQDLKRCLVDAGYESDVTVVLAQKRTSTRLFVAYSKDAVGNVPPGTAVDEVIVDKNANDFYMCSHFARRGTNKPVHYKIVYDEIDFSLDQMEELIFHLCFTYARCPKSSSVVPPVLYADIAAYRGLNYYKAASSIADQNSTYKLHHKLENMMFFI